MRSINLLPKKSFWSVWFVPLTTLLIFIYITAAVGVYYNLHTVRQQQEFASMEIKQIKQSIEALRGQRVPDPQVADLQQFQESVSQLEHSRIDWLPAVHTLIAELPSGAELEQGKAEEHSIAVEARFPTLQSVADYVRVMRSSKLYQEIQVNSITSQQQVIIGEGSQLGRMHYRVSLTLVLADEVEGGGGAP